MAKSRLRVGSVVIDVTDFGRMMTFWQDALGYVPRNPPAPGDDFMVLRDPRGKGPNVSIDRMEPLRGRIHMDLYSEDPEGEVARLLRIGATLYHEREPGEDFTVLADPEGNLFCVIDARSG
ncbi:MAG TPA: VOC family protein [Thermoplasmata archaeon]|nr:VOC family protein [Thermoplasmata archaeon]